MSKCHETLLTVVAARMCLTHRCVHGRPMMLARLGTKINFLCVQASNELEANSFTRTLTENMSTSSAPDNEKTTTTTAEEVVFFLCPHSLARQTVIKIRFAYEL